MEFCRILLLVVGCVLLLQLDPTECATRNTGVARLAQRLIHPVIGYVKSARPVVNRSETAKTKIGLTLLQISEINEKEQSLTLNVWLDQEWNDIRLQWKPKDHEDIRQITLDYKSIWRPDIKLYNSYGGQSMNPKLHTSLAIIHQSGSVFFPSHVQLKSYCAMNLKYFPFDEQNCTLKFGSWVYDGFRLDIDLRTEGGMMDLSNFHINPQWEVTGTSGRKIVKYYPCCVEPYPALYFNLTVRRRSFSACLIYLTPAVALCFLVPLVFLLPSGSGDKTLLGVGIEICTIILLISLKDYAKTGPEMPLIVLYYGGIFSLTALSLMVSTFFNALISGCQRGPPRCLFKLCTCCGLLCCTCREPEPAKSQSFAMLKPSDGFPAPPRAPPGEKSKKRWRLIATVIDRIFFVLFLGLVCALTAKYLIAHKAK